MASKTHVVLPGSKRGKDANATRVGDVDPKEKIVVTIGFRARSFRELTNTLAKI